MGAGRRGEPDLGARARLAIAREIVRAHGGEIWVDSGPGPAFTFTIPRSTRSDFGGRRVDVDGALEQLRIGTDRQPPGGCRS